MDAVHEVVSLLLGIGVVSAVAAALLTVFLSGETGSAMVVPEQIGRLAARAWPGANVTDTSYLPEFGFRLAMEDAFGFKRQLRVDTQQTPARVWLYDEHTPWNELDSFSLRSGSLQPDSEYARTGQASTETVVSAVEEVLTGKGLQKAPSDSCDFDVLCAFGAEPVDDALQFVIDFRRPHAGVSIWRAIASPLGPTEPGGEKLRLVAEQLLDFFPPRPAKRMPPRE